MTASETDSKRAFIKCDSCPAQSTPVSNSNRMRAQRVAVNFFGWRVFNDNGLWKHACPNCVAKWKNKLRIS
jgi:hypothetical protein